MEAEDRLAAQVAGPGRTLFVGFGPLAGAPVFHQDIRDHTKSGEAPETFAAWLETPDEPYDEVVLRMPRAKERLRMSLTMVRSAVQPGSAVTVVGHNDSGVRAAPRDINELVGPSEVVGTRWHCRAVRAPVTETHSPASLQDFKGSWTFEDIEVTTYPGVFAHGRLDPGTELLLRAIEERPMKDLRALDIGCGSGVIAATLAKRGATVDAVDADAVAVQAAAETGGPYAVSAFASDLYSAVIGPYDLIATNPPFHRDGRVSLTVAQDLIAGAHKRLNRRGELWMVVNRFIDHTDALRAGFASFDMVAEDGRYRVWRAKRG